MKNQEDKRGDIRSYVNGFLNLFSYFNLYQAKGSFGDKIIDLTNNSNIVNKPIAFAAGYLSEFISELAIPIYIASTSESIRWYHVLLADLAAKTVPRGLGRVVNWGKNKMGEEIISRLL